MKIALASLLPLVALAAEELYSYDPSADYGPDNWSMVDVSFNLLFCEKD